MKLSPEQKVYVFSALGGITFLLYRQFGLDEIYNNFDNKIQKIKIKNGMSGKPRNPEVVFRNVEYFYINTYDDPIATKDENDIEADRQENENKPPSFFELSKEEQDRIIEEKKLPDLPDGIYNDRNKTKEEKSEHLEEEKERKIRGIIKGLPPLSKLDNIILDNFIKNNSNAGIYIFVDTKKSFITNIKDADLFNAFELPVYFISIPETPKESEKKVVVAPYDKDHIETKIGSTTDGIFTKMYVKFYHKPEFVIYFQDTISRERREPPPIKHQEGLSPIDLNQEREDDRDDYDNLDIPKTYYIFNPNPSEETGLNTFRKTSNPSWLDPLPNGTYVFIQTAGSLITDYTNNQGQARRRKTEFIDFLKSHQKVYFVVVTRNEVNLTDLNNYYYIVDYDATTISTTTRPDGADYAQITHVFGFEDDFKQTRSKLELVMKDAKPGDLPDQKDSVIFDNPIVVLSDRIEREFPHRFWRYNVSQGKAIEIQTTTAIKEEFLDVVNNEEDGNYIFIDFEDNRPHDYKKVGPAGFGWAEEPIFNVVNNQDKTYFMITTHLESITNPTAPPDYKLFIIDYDSNNVTKEYFDMGAIDPEFEGETRNDTKFNFNVPAEYKDADIFNDLRFIREEPIAYRPKLGNVKTFPTPYIYKYEEETEPEPVEPTEPQINYGPASRRYGLKYHESLTSWNFLNESVTLDTDIPLGKMWNYVENQSGIPDHDWIYLRYSKPWDPVSKQYGADYMSGYVMKVDDMHNLLNALIFQNAHFINIEIDEVLNSNVIIDQSNPNNVIIRVNFQNTTGYPSNVFLEKTGGNTTLTEEQKAQLNDDGTIKKWGAEPEQTEPEQNIVKHTIHGDGAISNDIISTPEVDTYLESKTEGVFVHVPIGAFWMQDDNAFLTIHALNPTYINHLSEESTSLTITKDTDIYDVTRTNVEITFPSGVSLLQLNGNYDI